MNRARSLRGTRPFCTGVGAARFRLAIPPFPSVRDLNERVIADGLYASETGEPNPSHQFAFRLLTKENDDEQP